MSFNQTMLTLGAFLLLSVILTSFYRLLANSGDTINDAQAGISSLTYATTYMELAEGLSFDEVTVDSFLTTAQIGLLTSPMNLGPENPPPSGESTENNFTSFDDIDDLNNYSVIDSSLKGITGTFKTSFRVHYVNPLDLSQTSVTRTFVKRVDMTVCRLYPPGRDTLTHSIVMGYFHYD